MGMDLGDWATAHWSLSFQGAQDKGLLGQTCVVLHAASPGSRETVENEPRKQGGLPSAPGHPLEAERQTASSLVGRWEGEGAKLCFRRSAAREPRR